MKMYLIDFPGFCVVRASGDQFNRWRSRFLHLCVVNKKIKPT